MREIFISYRRTESSAAARALFERLRSEFGLDAVFIDLDGVEPGEDFVELLESQLRGCKVLLALIGASWLTGTDDTGQRRIDDEHDFVRLEIRTALERRVRVVPVLVEGARMPKALDLPEDIRALARRQALELDYRRFDLEVQRLVLVIRGILAAETPRTVENSPKSVGRFSGYRGKRWWAASAVMGIAAAGLLASSVFLQKPNDQEPTARVANDSAVSLGSREATMQTPSPPVAVRKAFTVGVDAAYPPFESQNERGEIVGFDVEILQAIGKAAGFDVKFVNTPWEGIFTSLNRDERDILASAITITPERAVSVDFSDPYFSASQLIAARRSLSVLGFADLKRLRVGVQTGTTGDEAATKLLGKTNPNVKRFESTPLALRELQNNGVDAVVADNGVILNFLLKNPDENIKVIADPNFTSEAYGFVVKKERPEVLALINSGLARIRADGTYSRIRQKYFGP